MPVDFDVTICPNVIRTDDLDGISPSWHPRLTLLQPETVNQFTKRVSQSWRLDIVLDTTSGSNAQTAPLPASRAAALPQQKKPSHAAMPQTQQAEPAVAVDDALRGASVEEPAIRSWHSAMSPVLRLEALLLEQDPTLSQSQHRRSLSQVLSLGRGMAAPPSHASSSRWSRQAASDVTSASTNTQVPLSHVVSDLLHPGLVISLAKQFGVDAAPLPFDDSTAAFFTAHPDLMWPDAWMVTSAPRVGNDGIIHVEVKPVPAIALFCQARISATDKTPSSSVMSNAVDGGSAASEHHTGSSAHEDRARGLWGFEESWTKPLVNFNANSNGDGAAKELIQIMNGVYCDRCWAYLSVGLEIAIQSTWTQLGIESARIEVTADAGAGAGIYIPAGRVSGQGSATFPEQPISFTLLGFSIAGLIDVSIDLTAQLKVDASMTATFPGDVRWGGDIDFEGNLGISYDGDSFTFPNGFTLDPGLRSDNTLAGLSGASVTGQLGVTPVLGVNILGEAAAAVHPRIVTNIDMTLPPTRRQLRAGVNGSDTAVDALPAGRSLAACSAGSTGVTVSTASSLEASVETMPLEVLGINVLDEGTSDPVTAAQSNLGSQCVLPPPPGASSQTAGGGGTDSESSDDEGGSTVSMAVAVGMGIGGLCVGAAAGFAVHLATGRKRQAAQAAVATPAQAPAHAQQYPAQQQQQYAQQQYSQQQYAQQQQQQYAQQQQQQYAQQQYAQQQQGYSAQQQAQGPAPVADFNNPMVPSANQWRRQSLNPLHPSNMAAAAQAAGGQ
jgi:hypothetical protein